MTPTPQPTTASRLTRATLFLAIGGALLFLAMPASAAADTPVCHATGSESNPYVFIMTSAAGAYNGHLGSDHQDGEDIIPPFEFGGETHSQNWDAEGQAIFAECDDAGTTTETDSETSGSETDSETSGSETDTETSGSETDSETSGSDTDTETEEIPVFGAPTTVALAIGGALGGALLMLRRKL